MLIVDALARRYGKAPHEILEWEPWQLTVAVACWRTGEAASAEAVRRASQGNGMVFPVVVLGGR